MTSPLIVCDLDGVVYLGDQAIPGSGEALAAMETAGARLVFCTNNSSRRRQEVADKISRITGYQTDRRQVVSSATAAATLLSPEDGPVFVVGGPGIDEAMTEVGVEVTVDAGTARAVVVGLDRDLSYRKLADATLAVRSGARLVATNRDATFPTPEGLLPGAGSMVALLETATGVRAESAGKPDAPMRRLIVDMAEGGEVAVVGDRPDTDLAMAVAEGWVSVLVLTGVATKAEDADPPADVTVASIADVPTALAQRLRLPSSADRFRRA